MSKPSSINHLLAQRGITAVGLKNNVEMQAATSQRLEKALATCGLTDEKGLAEIGRLLILERLHPSRHAAYLAELAAQDVELVKVTHAFITEFLSPKLANMETKATNFLTSRFREMMTPEDQIPRAVAESALMRRINTLRFEATIREPLNRDEQAEAAVAYAKQMLDLAERADALAKEIKG